MPLSPMTLGLADAISRRLDGVDDVIDGKILCRILLEDEASVDEPVRCRHPEIFVEEADGSLQNQVMVLTHNLRGTYQYIKIR